LSLNHLPIFDAGTFLPLVESFEVFGLRLHGSMAAADAALHQLHESLHAALGASPHLILKAEKFEIIGGRAVDVLQALAPLAGRCRIRCLNLDGLVFQADGSQQLQELYEVLGGGIEELCLSKCHMLSGGLAKVVPHWRSLQSLRVDLPSPHDASYEMLCDFVRPACLAVLGSSWRQLPLRVLLYSSLVDLSCCHQRDAAVQRLTFVKRLRQEAAQTIENAGSSRETLCINYC
jgi:hypothetical protein